VYVGKILRYPNNADITKDPIAYRSPPEDDPDFYKPSPDSKQPGENYYDRATQSLYVNLCGGDPITIRTEPVFVVSMEIQFTEETFFDPENIVNNIAALLNIDPSRIIVTNVVSESRRRKKRSLGQFDEHISFEIGPTLDAALNDDEDNPDVKFMQVHKDQNAVDNMIHSEEGRKQMSKALHGDIVGPIEMTPAQEPPPHPANETVGYFDVIEETGGRQTVGVPLTPPPKLQFYNTDGEAMTVVDVGETERWEVTATINSDTCTLDGDTTVEVIEGQVEFDNIYVDSPCESVSLTYALASPETADMPEKTSSAFSVTTA